VALSVIVDVIMRTFSSPSNWRSSLGLARTSATAATSATTAKDGHRHKTPF